MTSQKGTMKNGVEILIVEDSPSQAEQLKHILEQHDYSVSVAINGKEALALINKHKPTIVISDIIMPEMDGYELCRQIKADENLTNIPVILLTSLSDPEDIVRGLECGADNFVTKPYDERYILSHIQHILISKELRKSVRAEVDIEIFFAGKKYFINSERRQILDLLLSTYETAVQKNVKLIKAHDELRRLNEDLEKIVEERTAALTAEIAERKQANEVLRETLAHLSKKNRYETIISTVTRDVHQSINLQEVLENAVESMSENIELVDHIGIYLVEGEEVVLNAHRGLTGRYIKQAERIPYPKGATWVTIIKGKPSYVADTNQDTVIGPAGREMGIKSYLSMPIHFEGKTAGCINITSLQKNAFDEEELKLLEIVAKQIGVAINNARQAEALKQSKEEISRINEELENRVLQRTAELSAANKELDSFSYSVSHDLRAPLRGIDGFSHILLEDYSDKLDEEGKRLLNLIRGKTQRMGQLIEALLAFSRLVRQQIELTEIAMGELAKVVFDELKANTPQQMMQFKINTLPAARGDRSMIRQVFANLLSNAIKFTRRKENAIIEVNGWVEANENLYYVKDNGVGFDMQYVNKLFGVFQRLHSVEEFEGTGVGLAIVERIIRRHGGRVWAEGKVDESATFYFTIPYRGL